MDKFSLLSREQETKKVFFQLGKKFNLPLDIIILVYNSLRKSIYHDRSLQMNFHKNILSVYLCGPPYSIFDIDDEFFNTQNPFQYRLPIDKGNEWLIESDDARKENIFYHGLYNDLKPRDIINKQIEIYGAHARPEREKFILKYQVVRGREYTDTLEGMERIRFIDRIGIDLFDLYFDYLDNPDFNIIRYGQDTYLEMRFNEIEHINML